MGNKLTTYTKYVSNFVASKYFLTLVLAVVFVQGIWYALSFRPLLFDEKHHLDLIFAYKDHWSPFFNSQPEALDELGNVVRNPSYLFYYLMSIPLHVISLFSDSETIQIIGLRLVNIIMFVGALATLRLAFLRAGISKVIAHLVLLTFILIPAFAPLAGVVTYDVASFLLSSLLILWTVEILRSKDFEVGKFFWVLIVSGLIVEIKYTAIALAVPIVLFVIGWYGYRYKRKLLHHFKKGFRRLKLPAKIGFIIGLIIAGMLFVERPVMNFIQYGDPSPACADVVSKERCYENYTFKRNQDLLDTKAADFNPRNPAEYLHLYWIPGMTKTLAQQWPFRGPLPVMSLLVYSFVTVTIALLLINIRRIWNNQPMRFFLLIIAVYVAGLFYQLYGSYVSFGQPVAISGRYLMPIFPLLIVLGYVCVKDLISKRLPVMTTAIAICLFIASSQSGGVITHLLSVNDPAYYWQNEKVINFNKAAQRTMQPLVLE